MTLTLRNDQSVNYKLLEYENQASFFLSVLASSFIGGRKEIKKTIEIRARSSALHVSYTQLLQILIG